MKKTVLLNAPLSSVVARLGHGNSLCIGDAGLPVPHDVAKIDLAVSAGLPAFMDVLAAITSEMFVEHAAVAKELQDQQPQLYAKLMEAIRVLEADQNNVITVEIVPHEKFKAKTQACLAVVRTGECTPFANIILYAGVTF